MIPVLFTRITGFFRPSYVRSYFGVLAVLLFIQIKWALDFGSYDIIMRSLLSGVIALFVTPILITLFSITIRFIFRVQSNPRIHRIGFGILPPLMSFALYFPAYFFGRFAQRTHMEIWILLPILILAIAVWSKLAEKNGTPETKENALEFWRFLGSEILEGNRHLFNVTLFSKALFSPTRKRFFFQPLFWPLFFVHLFLIIRFKEIYTENILQSVLSLLFAFLLPLLLVNAIHTLAQGRAKVQAFMFLILFTFYLIFSVYHYNEVIPLDFNLVLFNSDLMFTPDAFHVYHGRAKTPVMLAALFFILWGIALQIKFRAFTADTPKKRSILFPLSFAIIFTVSLLIPWPVTDEFVLFARSMRSTDKSSIEENQSLVKNILSSPYPYIDVSPSYGRNPRPEPMPDVFLVLLEAFNQTWVEQKLPDGREVTPFFNSLIKDGLYVDVFYANAMQTCRALFTIFAGIPESSKHKAFRSFSKLYLRPLPTILEENSYRTIFFNAHDDLNFDNKGPYLRKVGFQKLVAMKGPLVADVPREKFWNWGIQDDVFYEKSFEWLDKNESTENPGQRPPVFATFLSLSQHHPYNFIPKELRKLYPDAKDDELGKGFLNAQNLADSFLKTFFEELDKRPRYRDAIIILMGDHGHPSGTHNGNADMCIGYADDNFRTPLLIIWKKGVTPRRTGKIAFQEIDLAPTMLDLLGINTPNHFIGRSILTHTTQTDIIYTQPNNGRWLVNVRMPFKYGQALNHREEILYDLWSDPGETINLANRAEYSNQLKYGRNAVNKLKMHQIYLELNRIWDKNLMENLAEKKQNK